MLAMMKANNAGSCQSVSSRPDKMISKASSLALIVAWSKATTHTAWLARLNNRVKRKLRAMVYAEKKTTVTVSCPISTGACQPAHKTSTIRLAKSAP